MILPFVGDAYKVLSPNLNCQTCINLYPVLDQKGGKSVSALYRTPGLSLFSDEIGDQGSVRALLPFNDLLYAIVDNILYRIDENGGRTELGRINTAVGRLSILNNGLQLGIFDGPNGYIYTFATGALTPITSSGFEGCIYATYQDGYGVLPVPQSEKWFITQNFDFSDINPLDFASTNQTPDNIQAAISSHQELWFFNDVTTEIWYDTGAELFPFQRRQTLVIQYGCVAPWSLLKADNSNLFWLGCNEQSRGVVCRLNGYNPEVISTEAVNYAISQYERIDDAFAFSYEKNGHLFYVLTFPTADKTWVYDISTNMWHERRSQITNTLPGEEPTRQGRWRPNCHALFAGKHIVGDFESGKLYYINEDAFDEAGTPITWERTGYHQSKDEEWIFCSNFQVILQAGVGLNTGQGSDPKIMLSTSKDFGHTFNAETWLPCGKMGEFKKRAIMPAMGAARDWVWRLRGTDPVFEAILGVKADLERGS